MENLFLEEFISIRENINTKFEDIISEYNNNGYAILESLFSNEWCDYAKDVFDSLETSVELSETPQVDKHYHYNKSEMRIWNAELRHDMFKQFKDLSDFVSSEILGKSSEAYNILAIRNRPLSEEDIDQYEGRWHLDSFREQFKSILFLTDTHKNSGPFEFLPMTHNSKFKNKLLFRGKVFTLSDLFSGKRAYQKLADEFVDSVKSEYPPKQVIVPKGSLVFINTSAIHRARPCKEDGRYALFSYYK